MFKRMSMVVVLALLITSVLTACGGGASGPVAFSSLPVFTGATETTNGILKAGAQVQRNEMKALPTVGSVEGKAYDVPAGTTFDAVAAFYKGALEKDGWTAVVTVTVDAPNMLGYTRRGQALVVTYVEAVGIWVMLSQAK